MELKSLLGRYVCVTCQPVTKHHEGEEALTAWQNPEGKRCSLPACCQWTLRRAVLTSCKLSLINCMSPGPVSRHFLWPVCSLPHCAGITMLWTRQAGIMFVSTVLWQKGRIQGATWLLGRLYLPMKDLKWKKGPFTRGGRPTSSTLIHREKSFLWPLHMGVYLFTPDQALIGNPRYKN